MSPRLTHAEEEFEAFWAAYPKRPGNPKLAAKKQWMALAKLGTLPSLSLILSAVKAYKANCTASKTAPEYIAHARTWLSQQRWADWLPQEDARQPAAISVTSDWTDAYPAWAAFKAKLEPSRWALWFSQARPNGSETTLIVPTRFDRDKIREVYEDVLERHFGCPVTVICRADAEGAKEKAPGSLERHPEAQHT